MKIDWLTIEEFSDAKVIDAEHKEQDEESAKKVAEASNNISNLHVLLRSDLEIGNDCTGLKAVLNIFADDYYKLYINDEFVAMGPAPGFVGDCFFDELDVSSFLRPGKNRLAIHLYYQGLVNRVFVSGDNRLAFFTNMTVNGREETLEWFYSITKAFWGDTIGYETQFLENFDSSLYDSDWKNCDYLKEGYKRCVPAVWADYNVSKSPVNTVCTNDVFPVSSRSFCEEGKTVYSYDFGEELAGCLYIEGDFSSAEEVLIRAGEELEGDRVRFDMRCNCRYEEKWKPVVGKCNYENYDYKAFRYVEIIVPGDAGLTLVKAISRHYPFDDNFNCYKGNDEKLKQIFEICKRSVKVGTQEGFLDCPSREKGQYLGDAIITGRSYAFLTGKTDMLRKCIRQFSYTKKTCPGLMAVAPGSLMQEIADFSLLFSELLLTDYEFTGDKCFLEEYYPVALGVTKYFSKYENTDGILDTVSEKWNLVDWPENLRDGYDHPLTRPIVGSGPHNVVNALYVGSMINLSKIEKILGKKETYDIEGRIKKFREFFFDEAKGLFKDSIKSSHCSLHSNVYPLFFGMFTKEETENAVSFLGEKGFSCGAFLSYFAMQALGKLGKIDELYRLLTNETEHGYMNMLREGATTCFEAWGKDQKWNTSLCHPWASGPVPIISEYFQK